MPQCLCAQVSKGCFCSPLLRLNFENGHFSLSKSLLGPFGLILDKPSDLKLHNCSSSNRTLSFSNGQGLVQQQEELSVPKQHKARQLAKLLSLWEPTALATSYQRTAVKFRRRNELVSEAAQAVLITRMRQ